MRPAPRPRSFRKHLLGESRGATRLRPSAAAAKPHGCGGRRALTRIFAVVRACLRYRSCTRPATAACPPSCGRLPRASTSVRQDFRCPPWRYISDRADVNRACHTNCRGAAMALQLLQRGKGRFEPVHGFEMHRSNRSPVPPRSTAYTDRCWWAMCGCAMIGIRRFLISYPAAACFCCGGDERVEKAPRLTRHDDAGASPRPRRSAVSVRTAVRAGRLIETGDEPVRMPTASSSGNATYRRSTFVQGHEQQRRASAMGETARGRPPCDCKYHGQR